MNVRFKPVTFTQIRGAVREHLNSLPSAIDSFLEAHVLESSFYRVVLSNHEAGFVGVHKGNLITQFVLTSYKSLGQHVFRQARELEEVQAAFVPTCDEFFLSHAIDDYRQLIKQAYFFAAISPLIKPPLEFSLRQAQKHDIPQIREGSGDFFGNLEDAVKNAQLFVTLSKNVAVGFGVLEKSQLFDRVASVGMFTLEEFRHKGVGTATLQLLQLECQRQNVQAVAGCWYYNHASKKTLERAGMFTQTRLLKIEF